MSQKAILVGSARMSDSEAISAIIPAWPKQVMLSMLSRFQGLRLLNPHVKGIYHGSY